MIPSNINYCTLLELPFVHTPPMGLTITNCNQKNLNSDFFFGIKKCAFYTVYYKQV